MNVARMIWRLDARVRVHDVVKYPNWGGDIRPRLPSSETGKPGAACPKVVQGHDFVFFAFGVVDIVVT